MTEGRRATFFMSWLARRDFLTVVAYDDSVDVERGTSSLLSLSKDDFDEEDGSQLPAWWDQDEAPSWTLLKERSARSAFDTLVSPPQHPFR